MLNKVFATAIALALTSSFANAYSLVTTKVVTGTIESVNAQQNVVVIEKASGGNEVLKFSEGASFYLDGNKTALSSLKAGNSVQIKQKTYTPSSEKIEGEIVALNHKEKSALIRVEDRDLVEVKFGDDVNVSGDMAISSFSELRRGHQVVVRYAK